MEVRFGGDFFGNTEAQRHRGNLESKTSQFAVLNSRYSSDKSDKSDKSDLSDQSDQSDKSDKSDKSDSEIRDNPHRVAWDCVPCER